MENRMDELKCAFTPCSDYASCSAENIPMHLRQSFRRRKTESSQGKVSEKSPENRTNWRGSTFNDNESRLQISSAQTLEEVPLGSGYQTKFKERTTEICTEEVGPEGNILYSCTICHYKSKWKRYLKDHQAVHAVHSPFSCPVDGCDYRTKWPQSVRRHSRSLHSIELPRKSPIKTKTSWRVKIDCQNKVEMEVNVESSSFGFACTLCDFIGDSELSALKHARQHRTVVITLE